MKVDKSELRDLKKVLWQKHSKGDNDNTIKIR
jgi:hypothetical protein